MVASHFATQMLKQVATCFSAALLVFSAVPAYAASSGNTHRMSSSFSSVDLSKGFYSGVEVGEARNKYGTDLATATRSVSIGGAPAVPLVVTPTSAHISSDDYFARLFMGWLFHTNLAVELGLLTLNKITVDKIIYVEGEDEQKATVNFGAVDLALKLILPVTDQIRFFTRLGLYYMRLSSDSKVTITSVGGVTIPEADQRFEVLKSGEDELSWLIGVGAIFAFSELLDAFFSWSHYSGNGITSFTDSSTGIFNDIDMLALGFIYHTN